MVLDDFTAVAVNIFNMPSLTAEEISISAISIRKAWDNKLWKLGINKRDYVDDAYRYSQEISTTQIVLSAAMDATQVGESCSQESPSAKQNVSVRKPSCSIIRKHLKTLSQQLSSQVVEIQARHQELLENIAEEYRIIACQALLGTKVTGELRVQLKEALGEDKFQVLKNERRRTTNRRYSVKSRKKRKVEKKVAKYSDEDSDTE